jgi:hypothetical protein
MKSIEKILEKYYEGETSLEEENLIQEYFNQNEISEEMMVHKMQFEFYDSESEKEELPDDFDDIILQKIEMSKVIKWKFHLNSFTFKIIGIAAGLMLVIGISFFYNYKNRIIPQKQKVILTAKDKANFDATLAALCKVSKYINLANSKLDKIKTYNNSIKKLNKVSYIDKYNKYVFRYFGGKS